MKKIPKSITVTVRNGDNFRASRPGKTYMGDGVEFDEVAEVFPGTPKPPYRLTYSLSRRGNLIARVFAFVGYVDVCKYKSGKFLVTTCFLPSSWDGLRVSRRVEKVKK